MKRKPNTWESVAPIELRHLKYPSNSFAPAINHQSNQEIGILYAGQSMMMFAQERPIIRKLFNEWRRGYYFTPKSRGKK